MPKPTTTPVADASVQLLQRYQDLLDNVLQQPTAQTTPDGCSPQHLRWMCATAIEEASSWPIDKLSRWLGFIQGVLIMQGLLTVDGEREFSRPLFHAAYAQEGLVPPPSKGPEKLSSRISTLGIHLIDAEIARLDKEEPGWDKEWR